MNHPVPRSCGRLTVTRSFRFSASHELYLLPPTHKCFRNHGHNYLVTLSAIVDSRTAGTLSGFQGSVKDSFDHRLLNDRVDFHPTSELLASHLVERFESTAASAEPALLIGLSVSETPATLAYWDCDNCTMTVVKKFVADMGEVTLRLGADGLDDFGFVTDFGDLSPFGSYLEQAEASRSTVVAERLAEWFIDHVEPVIHGYLISLRVESTIRDERWERSQCP